MPEVGLAEIMARDAGRCQLCGRKVAKTLPPHPLSPTLDHIVPLSRGGAHEPRNVQLAHWRCNVRRWNRGPAQTRLF